MELPDDAIREYQEITKKETGVDLTWDEAKQKATALLNVLSIITQDEAVLP